MSEIFTIFMFCTSYCATRFNGRHVWSAQPLAPTLRSHTVGRENWYIPEFRPGEGDAVHGCFVFFALRGKSSICRCSDVSSLIWRCPKPMKKCPFWAAWESDGHVSLLVLIVASCMPNVLYILSILKWWAGNGQILKHSIGLFATERNMWSHLSLQCSNQVFVSSMFPIQTYFNVYFAGIKLAISIYDIIVWNCFSNNSIWCFWTNKANTTWMTKSMFIFYIVMNHIQ